MRFKLRALTGHERGFIGEIAIIVIGVLIALGAGQLVEDWNGRRKLAEGERQLRVEATGNFGYAAEQVVVEPCIDAQLSALLDRVMASGATLNPAPVHRDGAIRYVYRLPSRPFVDSSWRALNTDGTATRMADTRYRDYSMVYAQLDNLREMRSETHLLEGRMRLLGQPLPLDAATRAVLVANLEEQRSRTWRQSLMSLQIMSRMRELGIAPADAETDEQIQGSGTVKFCRAQGLPLLDWRSELAKK